MVERTGDPRRSDVVLHRQTGVVERVRHVTEPGDAPSLGCRVSPVHVPEQRGAVTEHLDQPKGTQAQGGENRGTDKNPLGQREVTTAPGHPSQLESHDHEPHGRGGRDGEYPQLRGQGNRDAEHHRRARQQLDGAVGSSQLSARTGLDLPRLRPGLRQNHVVDQRAGTPIATESTGTSLVATVPAPRTVR